MAPLKRLAIALLAFLSPSALFAQGCAMCYQTAAGSGAQFIQALRDGILIMFFPPILIMGAIFTQLTASAISSIPRRARHLAGRFRTRVCARLDTR